MTTAIWDALASEGDFAPIFKFADPGDRIGGVIVEEPRTLPLTEYGSREPKIGPDGKPVLQILVTLATEVSADENHDGRWRVYVDKPLMKSAVARALKAAGSKTLAVGDKLTVTFTGMRETRGGGSAKDFTAEYTPAAPCGDESIGTATLGEFIDGDPFSGAV